MSIANTWETAVSLARQAFELTSAAPLSRGFNIRTVFGSWVGIVERSMAVRLIGPRGDNCK
jgi:hypothetical protein